VKRSFSLGCALLAGALAACQQTWKLDDLAPDGSRSGTGGTTGNDGGGKGGFAPSDASADGRCPQGPQVPYKGDVPQVVVLLDRSELMNVPFDSKGDTPLTEAQSAIFTEVTNFGGSHGVPPSIDFAFFDFPDNTATDCSAMLGCCPSDVTTNYSQFETQAACNTSGPNQCSSLRPTANALNAAQHYFVSEGSPAHDGERYVLLITADDPDLMCSNSCIDAINAVSNLASSAAGNATTEIVALASSSECLVDLADAQHGVSPPPYYPTSPSNFGGVIHPLVQDISRDGCRLTLTTQPTSAGGVTVYLGGQRQSPDTGTGNGWVYDNSSTPSRVYLHGSLCDQYLNPSNMFDQLAIYDGCGPDHFGGNP
jgi:hypothetical protein